VQIGFQRRFDAGYVEARRMIRSGEVGTVYLVRMAGHDPAPPHESYIPTSGGLFRDFTVHDFDIVRWLLDDDVEEVWAIGAVREFPVFAKYDDVDTAVATMRMRSGALVSLDVTRDDPRGYDVRTEIFGSRESIAVGLGPRTPIRSVEPGIPAPTEPGWPGFYARFTPAYVAELTAFIGWAIEGGPSPCSARDAVEAIRVAEAATRSLREHRAVRIDEITG
jgi:myo-inositol 2-dehydrogenase/D-chiro-inositol 1-dehydrogenase